MFREIIKLGIAGSWWLNCWFQLIAPNRSSGRYCLPLELAAGWPVPQFQNGGEPSEKHQRSISCIINYYYKQLLWLLCLFGTTYSHQFQISFKMVTSSILREVGEKDRVKVIKVSLRPSVIKCQMGCQVNDPSQSQFRWREDHERTRIAANRSLSLPAHWYLVRHMLSKSMDCHL